MWSFEEIPTPCDKRGNATAPFGGIIIRFVGQEMARLTGDHAFTICGTAISMRDQGGTRLDDYLAGVSNALQFCAITGQIPEVRDL